MGIYSTIGGKSITELPQVATNLEATAAVGGIDMEWVNNNTNVTGTTNIPQLFEDGIWVDQDTLASTATTYSVVGLSVIQDYNVRVSVLTDSRYYSSKNSISTVLPPPQRPASAVKIVGGAIDEVTTSSIYQGAHGMSGAGWIKPIAWDNNHNYLLNQSGRCRHKANNMSWL